MSRILGHTTRRTALSAAAGILASPATLRAQARTLRFGHVHAIDHPHQKGAERAAAVLAERTGGRLQLATFPSAQLGRGQEMVQQVADGTLDFAVDGPALLSQWIRPLSIFEAPYLARDAAHFQRMWASPYARGLQAQLVERRSIRTLPDMWYFGTRQMTSNRPLRAPDDLKGFKLRVPEVPLYVDMARALGAAPTPMAFAEVYLGLQTGTVDGQENPLPTIWAGKFHEVQKCINLTGHIVLGLLPMISEKTWGSLTAADRDAVVEAFREGGRVADGVTTQGERELTDRFRQAGLQIVEPELPRFRDAMAPVYAKYEDIWGKGEAEKLRAL